MRCSASTRVTPSTSSEVLVLDPFATVTPSSSRGCLSPRLTRESASRYDRPDLARRRTGANPQRPRRRVSGRRTRPCPGPFSTNEAIPIVRSSVANSAANCCRSISSPVSRSVSSPRSIASLAARRAYAGPAANCAAQATRLGVDLGRPARPGPPGRSRSASSAPTKRPVKMMSLAFGRPDQPGQPLGAAGAGDDAEQDLGLAELRVVGRDPDVGAQRELAAAAERVAGDGGDDGLGDPRDGGEADCSRRSARPCRCRTSSAISLMSAPAAKTFSPPYSTTARMSSRSAASCGGGPDLLLHLDVRGRSSSDGPGGSSRLRRQPRGGRTRRWSVWSAMTRQRIPSGLRQDGTRWQTQQPPDGEPTRRSVRRSGPGPPRARGAGRRRRHQLRGLGAGRERRRRLPVRRRRRRGPAPPARAHLGVWHGYVPGVGAGQRYGFRAARPVGPGARATSSTPPSCCSTRTPTPSTASSASDPCLAAIDEHRRPTGRRHGRA